MKKPTKKTNRYYDFLQVMHFLEKKTGKNFRDYAGKYSKEGQRKNKRALKKWLKDNGYADKAYVLDVPDPKNPNIDWPNNSKEIQLRREINSNFEKVRHLYEVPYQDFWHWLLDLNNVFNGCFIYLPSLDYMDDPKVEPWKKEIMQHFYDFLGKDYNKKMWCEW